jgi:hypothetical protein
MCADTRKDLYYLEIACSYQRIVIKISGNPTRNPSKFTLNLNGH